MTKTSNKDGEGTTKIMLNIYNDVNIGQEFASQNKNNKLRLAL